MARLKLRNIWGSEYEITLRINHYANNGNLAIEMFCWDEGFPEPYGILTVNLDKICKPNCAYVDTNNNPGIDQWIEKNNLGTWTGNFEASGFCYYPEFEFNMDEINKYVEG